MADAYILNAQPPTYGAATSLIVEMLVSAGWTYKASGDGLSAYNATGKVFTGAGAGATGWNNTRAWARLADPAGRREICIQHAISVNNLRFKYSASAKFIGGSPSANTVPSATDERVMWGTGTDAAPTFFGFYGVGTATGACKFHGRANSAAPYGFWVCSNNTPGAVIACGLMMDPVTSVPEDIDPVIWHIAVDGAYNTVGWGHASGAHDTSRYPVIPNAQGCFGHRDAAATAFVSWMPGAYSLGSGSYHGDVSVTGGNYSYLLGRIGGALNPFNAKVEAMPVPYMRCAPGLGFQGLKGWSTLARWAWGARVHAVDTMDNLKWIAIGHIWLPWDGVTIPSN